MAADGAVSGPTVDHGVSLEGIMTACGVFYESEQTVAHLESMYILLTTGSP